MRAREGFDLFGLSRGWIGFRVGISPTTRMSSRFRNHVLSRLPNGSHARGVLTALVNYWRTPDTLRRMFLLNWLSGYCRGVVHCGAKRRYLHQVADVVIEPVVLFHLTYADRVESIRRDGIRAHRGMVFLTDAVSLSEFYYPWKDAQLGSPQTPVVITLDTRTMLRDGLAVFALDRTNEYVTQSIPPRYVVAIEA